MDGSNLFGPISQLGYLTDDIERSARGWTATSGIGPWTLMRGVVMPTQIAGGAVEIEIDVAMTYKDDVQIELIKPLNDVVSPYRDHMKAGLWGLHHVQFTTSDIEAAVAKGEAAGLNHYCRIDQGGGKYSYMHGPGIWFELIESSPALDGLFAMIKSAAKGWDGKDLIIEMEI